MKAFTRIINGLLVEYSYWEFRQKVKEIMREPVPDSGKIAPRMKPDPECLRIWSSPGYIDIDAMIRYEKRKAG